MTVNSFWQQSLGDDGEEYYSAARMRVLERLLWPSGADGVRLVGPDALRVTALATPARKVQVNTGWARRSGYLAQNDDAAKQVDLDAADGALPRIDRIVMLWTDTEAGDAESGADIVAIAGDPDASPSPPSLVGMTACLLAEVYVAAGATTIGSGAITDKRTLVSAGDLGRAQYKHTGTNLLPSDGSFNTLVNWTLDIDTLGLAPSGGAWTIPADGFYELTAELFGDPGGWVAGGIFLNGSPLHVTRQSDTGSAVVVCPLPTREYQLEAGDQLTIQGRAQAAGTHTVVNTGAGQQSFLRVKRVG